MLLMTRQGVGWKLAPGVPSLEIIYLQPEVMETFQKQLLEEQKGPLTHISSSQGFFPYKVWVSQSRFR